MCFGGTTINTTSTTDTSSQTDLPDWAKPYFERNIARAEAEYTKPYEAYTGQRIANTDPNTLAARQATVGIAGQGIAGLPQAQQYTQAGMQAAQQLGQYNPTQFSEFQYAQPQTFTGGNVSNYMSPYMQNVVDVQKQQAILDFDRQAAGRNAQAVKAGAFGGSRQAVANYLAEEGLQRQLGNIQATGQQQAYEQAAAQFGADRAAQMQVEAARAAELGRVQSGTEAAKQFGAGQGLAALQVGQGLAGDLTKQGELARQTDIQNAQLLEGVGTAQTAEQQQRLDLDYQNWLAQQGYTREQIGNMTGILAGMPIAATGSTTGTQTTVGSQPGPSPFQQIVGAGLTGISLYNAYR